MLRVPNSRSILWRTRTNLHRWSGALTVFTWTYGCVVCCLYHRGCAPGVAPASPSEKLHRSRSSGLLVVLSLDRGGVGALACRCKCAAAQCPAVTHASVSTAWGQQKLMIVTACAASGHRQSYPAQVILCT